MVKRKRRFQIPSILSTILKQKHTIINTIDAESSRIDQVSLLFRKMFVHLVQSSKASKTLYY